MPPDPQPDRSRGNNGKAQRGQGPSPWLLAGAGLELAGSVGGMTVIGWLLDRRLDTEPWLLLAGLAIGLTGGLYSLWRTGRRFFD